MPLNEIAQHYYILSPEEQGSGAPNSGQPHIAATEDVNNRENNPRTARHRLWRIKTAVALTNKQKALDFEEYLKTSSGRAFAKKRL